MNTKAKDGRETLQAYTTIKLRLSDRHAAALRRKARAVNFVWNYCNETQMKAAKAGRRWLSAYDLGKLCAGSSKALGLHSNTIDAICHQYAHSRNQQRKPWLRFRGRLPPGRPRGIAGLGIRQFDCSECGLSLNRDVNAARNILARFSQETLAEGAAQ